ncbi:MAG: hypothetical protein M3067_08190 [Chloroflexota bacterium]|nr:hypothetical protein [Chloroflexota bacterium]
MHRFRGFSLLAALAALALVIVPMTAALADGGGRHLSATPWVYVGKANDPNGCGNPYPAGSRIVTSAWLGGMGLPDDGTSPNTQGPVTSASATAPSANDPHLGLLLNKNGPTGDCSSAGATINGVKGMVVTATFHLGYDYRNGGHCGAGAPRFNVDTDKGFFFVGCANAPQVGAPQDPGQWMRTRSIVEKCGSECFAGSIPDGATIKSIDIVFDEGTDTANNDTQGVGLAVIDNIDINGTLITRGSGIEPGGGGGENDDHGGHGGHGGGNNDNGGGRNGD